MPLDGGQDAFGDGVPELARRESGGVAAGWSGSRAPAGPPASGCAQQLPGLRRGCGRSSRSVRATTSRWTRSAKRSPDDTEPPTRRRAEVVAGDAPAVPGVACPSQCKRDQQVGVEVVGPNLARSCSSGFSSRTVGEEGGRHRRPAADLRTGSRGRQRSSRSLRPSMAQPVVVAAVPGIERRRTCRRATGPAPRSFSDSRSSCGPTADDGALASRSQLAQGHRPAAAIS